MKSKGLFFGFLLFISLSVSAQVKNATRTRKPVHRTAFELNEIAILLFHNFGTNPDSIKKSIKLLDNAISTDSTYYTAYINKASLLCELGQNDELLAELEAAIKIYKKDPQLICMEAYILEKTEQTAAAKLKYREADTLYDRLIKANENLVCNKLGKAFLALFIKDKKEGIKEYKKIARLYNDKSVLLMKNAFFNFDRDIFIKTYCIPPQPLQNRPEICLNEVVK